jgi:hypothetical protein
MGPMTATRTPKIWRFRSAAAAATGALLLVPAVAFGWAQRANFETRIHGHEFYRVVVETNQCELKMRVLFTAPQAGYEHESPARNFYRFHARLQLDQGRDVVTRIFSNAAPGTRGYNYVLDTSADACWAKQEHKIRGVDIEGCRGSGCTPEPFK